MERERKALPLSLKADGAEGSFRAVFASFDVIDLDGDVTRAGAFREGEPVIIGSWGHKTYDLPVGKGMIVTDDREAAVEGEFFLDTQPGRDTYQTVKNLGALGEWSYVFTVEQQSFGELEGRQVRYLEGIKVYSVDPVLAGAGIGTRTTDIKGLTRDLTFAAHSAQVEELVGEYLARVKERAAIRAKEGRQLSTANVGRLSAIAESLKGAAGELEQLLADAEPKTNELVREFLRFQRIRAGIPA